ncbi:MAG: hypothetical protein ACRDNE_10075 [Gaiellaceae bacterium]
MPSFQVAGHTIELEHEEVEERLRDVLPEPLTEHYVVIRARRYPPKQVLSEVTGLDRADFTTHQARRILKRLGFTAARALRGSGHGGDVGASQAGPHGGRQAAALEPYAGQWVALAGPTEVLVAADSPQDVLAWLARHERKASGGMFRVPARLADAEGLAPR